MRARSLSSARPFHIAVFFSAIHYLGLIAALTSIGCLIYAPSQTASRFLLGSLAFSIVAWFVAFFERRSARCPLCLGTPLFKSGARTHIRAKRLGPLNAGVTATLSILAAQKFRCMYCGSDFDLLKRPSRSLSGTQAEPSDDQDSRS